MKRTVISSGSAFESQIGYSRAVVAGDWVFVSGTTGFDYRTMAISSDIAEQPSSRAVISKHCVDIEAGKFLPG